MINKICNKQKYNNLYKKAKEIIDKNNPCKFKNGVCIHERNNIKEKREVSQYCCCKSIFPNEIDHCIHFYEDIGCTVKALLCKTWFCEDVYKNLSKKVKRKLIRINNRAYKLKVYNIRESMEDFLYKI